ncbi:MAG: LicD family protein [Paludibacteraceae bacterium]|nr:LicD family protein [Paludibacteraceae bacterium]HOU67502.1 LicD family protein [Paludibacteraceae bacterium]
MRHISLDELKQIQLNIMKTVHQFCVDNGLKYTLAYGSMLGAVRHGGFIPWDDDIDIIMPRKDYDVFVRNFRHEYINVYDSRKDIDYCYPFAKAVDSRTVLEENTALENHGVDIDIFPLDDMFDDYSECLNFMSSVMPLKKKFRYKLVRPSYKNVWWKKILIRLANLSVSFYSLRELVDKLNRRYAQLNDNGSKYVCMAVGTECTLKGIFLRSLFEDFEMVPFEDCSFMCIKNRDAFLKQVYGDYMQLPREDKRVSPHAINNVYWKE